MLGYELRKKGTPHNCLDDACAAMKLVLAKIEGGVDNVIIPMVHKDVSLKIKIAFVYCVYIANLGLLFNNSFYRCLK